MIRILRAACLLAACAAMGAAGAAGNDDLWEITTQMNMAGLPAGMGGQTQQLCTEKDDPRKAVTRGKGMEKCQVLDMKQAGNRVTITIKCPDSTATIENEYNAARTEYKGSVKMTSREGDMLMTTSGRKVGSCDAQQVRAEQQAKIGAIQQQVEKMRAEQEVRAAKAKEARIAECRAGVDTMRVERIHGADGECEDSRIEFCTRYQTMDGFLKAGGDARAASVCKVSREQLIAGHCSSAVQTNLAYLGRFCPNEAKPLAKQHCAGRSFTSRKRDQYTDFCTNYLAQHNLNDEDQPAASSQPRAATVDPKQAITDGVTQGVTQGINKLRGLFGR